MRTAALALLALLGTAHAQYKCVAPNGAVTFQQTGCPMEQKQQVLRSSPAVAASVSLGASTTAPGKSMDERILATMQRDRRLQELEQSVADTEANINSRNVSMSNEMETVRSRKVYARNNLAGATWEQSLSTEMQAVASKYKAMNDVDIERLKVLRADLEATRRLAAK